MEVMKKKMMFLVDIVSSKAPNNIQELQTYMMPKAHDALSMAHGLSTFNPHVLPETVNNPRSWLYCPVLPQSEQSASEMPRSS